MNKKLDRLESIRGLAALYVVFHHTFAEKFEIMGFNFSFLFKFGQEAVILFFILSGFVIGYSFIKVNNHDFFNYFKKRFYRIYLPLVIVLMTNYLLNCLYAGTFIDLQLYQLVGNLLMLQEVAWVRPNTIVEPYLSNDVLWSLSYEWWFYMFFYFTQSIFKTDKKYNLAICSIVILSSISYIFYPFFVNRLLMYFGLWWIGLVMARSYIKNSRVIIKDLILPAVTILIAIFILALNVHLNYEKPIMFVYPILELRHFVFAGIAIVVALLWQRFNWKYFDITIGKFKIFASFSYVLYISHFFLVSKALYLNFIGNIYIEFFFYLVITLIYSYLVELKFYPSLRELADKRKLAIVLR